MLAVAGRPGQLEPLLIDAPPIGLAYALVPQRHQAALKRIRQETGRAGIKVRLVDRSDAVGMRQVPEFEALALRRTGAEDLRSHRAVHQDDLVGVQDVEEALRHEKA